MSDMRSSKELVKSLRDYSEGPTFYWGPICQKAAEEIERLQRELAASAAQYQEACDDANRFARERDEARASPEPSADYEDAYFGACKLMEEWHWKRQKEGKEAGTTGSLQDGIGWLFGEIERLERASPPPCAGLNKVLEPEKYGNGYRVSLIFLSEEHAAAAYLELDRPELTKCEGQS